MNLKWWCFYWDFWVSFFLRLYEYYDMYYNVYIILKKSLFRNFSKSVIILSL